FSTPPTTRTWCATLLAQHRDALADAFTTCLRATRPPLNYPVSKRYGGKNVVSSAKHCASTTRTETRMRTRVTRRTVRDRPRKVRGPKAPADTILCSAGVLRGVVDGVPR